MRRLSILEPVSKEFLQIAATRRKFAGALDQNYIHPQEDFLLQSEKYPIFVVADGVTLELDKENKYPNPSGAGELARVFCTSVIQEAERLYDNFEEKDLQTVFALANKDAGAYNASQGRNKNTINYWDFDFFAATTAFMLVKGNAIYWWTLCDAGFLLCDKEGKEKFISPPVWTEELNARFKALNNLDSFGKRTRIREIYRNGVNEQRELIGYGVVTGEDVASRYVNTGVVDFEEGDIAMIYTDGFEEYIKASGFRDLFKKWPETLTEDLDNFSKQKISEDSSKYGHERSLIVVANK